ncbi:hypothetical protein ACYOEI_22890 [Singulisphaera rosea]
MSGHPDFLLRLSTPKRKRKRSQFRLATLLGVVALSAAFLGVWRAPPSVKPTRMSGVVAYLGQPIGSGIILFNPLDATGRKASGVVVNGSYVVKEGLLPGRYAIGVQDSKKSLPVRYTLPNTSGLEVEIRGVASNQFDFDLR